jgi:hypothetical protein
MTLDPFSSSHQMARQRDLQFLSPCANHKAARHLQFLSINNSGISLQFLSRSPITATPRGLAEKFLSPATSKALTFTATLQFLSQCSTKSSI